MAAVHVVLAALFMVCAFTTILIEVTWSPEQHAAVLLACCGGAAISLVQALTTRP